MSTVSADECYSNVDCVEELRRLCGDRDKTIGKLKVIASRKNKIIAALEEELKTVKSTCDGLETAKTQLEGQVTRLSLNTESVDEINRLNTLTGRLQSDLERRKKEVETLSKLNSDLQKSITSVKQERDRIKAEEATLKAECVIANTTQKELFDLAVSTSPKSPPNQPSQHLAFILSTFKDLKTQGHSDAAQSALPPHLSASLASVFDEINLLCDGKTRVEVNDQTTTDELCRICESAKGLLSARRKSERIENIQSKFKGILDTKSELTNMVGNFNKEMAQNLQSVVTHLSKLAAPQPPQRVHAPAAGEKCGIVTNELTQFRQNLSEMRSSVSTHAVSMKQDLVSMQDCLRTILKSIPNEVITDEGLVTLKSKLRRILAMVPHFQGEIAETKAIINGELAWFNDETATLQKLCEKLSLCSKELLPPPYTDVVKTPSASSIEALFTEIWQIKDSLSGVKYYVTEKSSQIGEAMQNLAALQCVPLRQTHDQLATIRAELNDMRNEALQITATVNNLFFSTTKSPVSTLHVQTSFDLPNAEEHSDLQRQLHQQTQRFEDYDRLVRDKEKEINQLRETCDRLTALHDALKAIAADDASPSSFDLRSEDSDLLTRLLKRSQLANLELADQANALENLRDELAERDARLAELTAKAAEATALQEKLTKAKQLCVRARKDAAEAERRSERVDELEMERKTLVDDLEECRRLKESAETVAASARREAEAATRRAESKTLDLIAERDSALHRLETLQTQFEGYKVKALHALRSGQLSEGSGAEPLSDKMDALSWRYECSSMAVAEAARLKETVKALEKSLDETASQLASVKAEFEAVNFALAEKKEECQRLSQVLATERAQWRVEREDLSVRVKEEADIRIAQLEASIAEEKRTHTQQLTTQAEDFKFAYGAKISDLEARLEQAEAQAEARRLELLRRAEEELQAPPSPPPPLSQPTVCLRCQATTLLQQKPSPPVNGPSPLASREALFGGSSSPKVAAERHTTRPLEQVLFGEDETASVDSLETERNAQLHSTIDSLRTQLANEQRNLESTRSLLIDSEATVERLTAQANILKSEIRRHERNAERDTHLGVSCQPQAASPSPPERAAGSRAHSSSPALEGGPVVPDAGITRNEYLKNVVIKFIDLPSTAVTERSALVPVLSTLLALSPPEREVLQKVAQTGALHAGGGAATANGQSWGSYLSSWAGY